MSATVNYPLLEDPSVPDSGMVVTYMASGDLNGDGMLDLVVMVVKTTLYENYGIGVFFGEPDGGLSTPTLYEWHSFWDSAVTLADVNGDGFLDVIAGDEPRIGDWLTPGVSVFLNDGDGELTWAGSFPVTVDEDHTPGINSIGVADFNGDGRPDLVVSQWLVEQQLSYLGIVEILWGNSDGGFDAPVVMDGVGSTFYGGIAVGDLNGDGITDISAEVWDAGILLLLGQGDGGFERTLLPYFVWWGTDAVLLPSDAGHPDLLVATWDLDAGGSLPGILQVFDNAGDGAYTATPAESGGGGSLAIGDFNGDCIPDVASVGQMGNEYNRSYWITVHYGSGRGRVGAPHALPVTGSAPFGLAPLGPVDHPRALAVGDMMGGGITVYGDASR